MSHPYLVEESSLVELAPNLERLVMSLDNNANHHDYLVAVVIVVLAETGFFITPEDDQEGWRISSLYIPRNWKSNGIYQFTLRYNISREIVCKLVGVPTGDTMILNLCNGSTRCIVFQTLKYINPHSSDISGRFWNLKEFSFRLKNELLTPLRVELLTKFGLPSPSLHGLPEELKIHIFRRLDPKSRRNLSLCCQQYSEINLESRGHSVRIHGRSW
ncbi:F-box only protein 7-like [Belonocnema kinseyi]|uniref:F-box only protein 7-like n=1 Tax=Belonocnema kinseyi TaxID=2817044 RepID=UPI00143D4DF2|nr:F-box only protein 7-like [Belonocnema kinseyi]